MPLTDAIFSPSQQSCRKYKTKPHKFLGVHRVREDICTSSLLRNSSFRWPAEIKCWTLDNLTACKNWQCLWGFCSKGQHGCQEPLQLMDIVSDYCSPCWQQAAASPAALQLHQVQCQVCGQLYGKGRRLLLFLHHCQGWGQWRTDTCPSVSSLCLTSYVAFVLDCQPYWSTMTSGPGAEATGFCFFCRAHSRVK